MGASPTFFVAKALSSYNYVEITYHHNSQNSTTLLMQPASSQEQLEHSVTGGNRECKPSSLVLVFKGGSGPFSDFVAIH
jgi:hypothetical protein